MQIPIYIESTGQGLSGQPELALIHGWGLHGGVWQAIAEDLASDHVVHCIDLPGHGNSPLLEEAYDLENVATAVASALSLQTSKPLCLVGWSLGGMVAMQIALNSPEWIRALTLVATNLRFTRTDDWPHAMDQDVLNSFAELLENDYEQTLERFFALQTFGIPEARSIVRDMKQRLANKREPDIRALRGGLRLLNECDLRDDADSLTQPVQLIMGEMDKLVPVTAGAVISDMIASSDLLQFPKAGHAPFLSHPQQFTQAIRMHCDSVRDGN